MSSTSSRVSAVSASASNEPECEPLPSARSIPTAAESSPSTGQLSLFSETSEPSQQKLWPTIKAADAERGGRGDLLAWVRGYENKHYPSKSMSSAAVSPVKTSQSPERVQVLKGAAAAYGRITPELLARFDPDTSSWRTSQLCLDGAFHEFSETWPRSGLMRNGTAYQLPPLVRLTEGTESGLWPTPVVPNGGRSVKHVDDWRSDRSAYHNGKKVQVDLAAAVRMWPTPTRMYTRADWSPEEIQRRQEEVKAATLAKGKHHTGNGFGLNLAQAVRMLPTPTSRDWKSGMALETVDRRKDQSSRGVPLSGHVQRVERNSGALNPRWVEWLMGFPIGWTVLSPSETPSSRKSRKSSAKQS
jgi:hypothetical protein